MTVTVLEPVQPILEKLSGATRLIPVVGDPIAQVRAPFGMTAAFESRWSITSSMSPPDAQHCLKA